jgi:hypothetical protein
MRVRYFSIGIGALCFIFSLGTANGQHGHGGHSPSPSQSASPSGAMKPVQSIAVEGWKISFEVMRMDEHMKHGAGGHGSSPKGAGPMATHSFMVKIQDTFSKEIISDARVRFTTLSPSRQKEEGTLTWSGDHYGGGFSPKEKGAYQVELKIESGGMEREAKFAYDAR